MDLLGYDKLCEGGIRFVWKDRNYKQLIESASFESKTRNIEQPISGYTTSVSMGCILKSMGYECKFCRTGKKLQFYKLLSAYDIAKQNILMVLVDKKNNLKKQREFAYMGQGEPGYSYIQLRQAIRITDYVMNQLDEVVYRHIISTSGVAEMIDALADDLERGYFDSRITLHFSLHNITDRNILMPINQIYSYESLIDKMIKVSKITDEKICIGILLLNKFSPKGYKNNFTLNKDEMMKIVSAFDKKFFRFSFCEFNESIEVGKADMFVEKDAMALVDLAKNIGYDVKLFSSFGKKENAACGMLGGAFPEKYIDEDYSDIEKYADELIESAIHKLF